MANRPQMTDSELVAIIRNYRYDALGADNGELSSERAEALDRYHGRPYGNEKEGRSAVTTKNLSETTDWVMAGLMRIFLQSGSPVEFMPVGDEDEEAAQQETDYINHVMTKDNNAFVYMYDWFKDALLLKNGYIKHYWDESEKSSRETYSGLSDEDVLILLQNLASNGDEVEIVAQDSVEVALDPMGQPVFEHDIEVEITKKISRVRIEAVPVEEIRVSKDCRYSTQDAAFVEHVTKKTRTELMEMGMDEDFVYSLPSYGDDDETDAERRARDSVSDESDEYHGAFYDRSMDEIEYCEAYVLVDYNGDGKAERRKIVTCANRIPPGDEWNEQISSVPITSITPKRVPHRHIGESLNDDISDLQEIDTTLFRQMLDNIYRTNNQEIVVNNDADIETFLQSLPGGIKVIDTEGPVQNAFAPLQYQPILNQILPAIDHVQGLIENRTGVNELNTNVSADVLKESNNAVFMEGLNKASQKTEMIARHFAEGVKELALRVHELIIKHQDRERVIKLRGRYVNINPQQWKERTDMTVNVGLGTGSEEEKRQNLMMISTFQERLAAMGLVLPHHAYEMFEDLVATLGVDRPDKYAVNPKQGEMVEIPVEMLQQMQQAAQGGQSNPLAEAEQIKANAAMSIAQMKQQTDAQIAQMKEAHKSELEMIKQQSSQETKILEILADLGSKSEDRASREDIEAMKAEVSAYIEGLKLDIGKPGIGAGMQEPQRTFDPKTGNFL